MPGLLGAIGTLDRGDWKVSQKFETTRYPSFAWESPCTLLHPVTVQRSSRRLLGSSREQGTYGAAIYGLLSSGRLSETR